MIAAVERIVWIAAVEHTTESVAGELQGQRMEGVVVEIWDSITTV